MPTENDKLVAREQLASEIDFLLECTDKQKRNEWIWRKYSLEPQQIIPSDS